MAKCKRSNQENVLLGFEDEVVTEKHKTSVGYWTNKIGGCPDWPVTGITSPLCKLCSLSQPLVVQIYAPLENSPYHRTLYIFGCINPNCWNQNQSWTCIRSQLVDTEYEPSASMTVNPKSNVEWCTGSDDWDDDNGNFENGNVKRSKNQLHLSDNESDDDSSSLSAGIGNLNVDECNANWGGVTGNVEKNSGAVGKQISPTATAEIEGDESEVVSIDTPTAPQRDLIALLQETAPVPYHVQSGERNQNNSIYFGSAFISVCEESPPSHSDHIKDLIQEYQKNHGDFLRHNLNQGGEDCEPVSEKYEKAVPAHGDKLFHRFLTRIQANPGQILRYSRESSPLLLYPLNETPKKCHYCNGNVVFELQLLPTLIPKLKLPDDNETHLEFGTVFIYACEHSCWSSDDKFREENVIVQVESP